MLLSQRLGQQFFYIRSIVIRVGLGKGNGGIKFEILAGFIQIDPMQWIGQYLKRGLGCLIALLIPLFALTQDFAYYRLGKGEVLSQHIYTLLYSSSQQLYVGTNEGAYVYKNGSFQLIPLANGDVSGAVFGLRENSKGEIFCFNLVGEIFQVKEQQLLILATLPKKHLASGIQMEVDDQDELVLFSRGVLKWSNESWTVIHNQDHQAISSKHPKDGSLFFNYINYSSGDEYFIWQNKQLIERSFPDLRMPNRNDPVMAFVFFDQDTFASYASGVFVHFGDGKTTTIPGGEPRSSLYQFDSDKAWNSQSRLGLVQLNAEAGQLLGSQLYLPSNFISTVFQSASGTLFLGTFGQGIIVVPETKIESFRTPVSKSPVNRIAVDDEDAMYALTRTGNLYRYREGQRDELPYNSSLPPNYLFVVKPFDFGRNTVEPALIHPGMENGRVFSSVGSLKNIKKINDSCLIGFNSNFILRYGKGLEGFAWVYPESQKFWSYLNLKGGRYWDVDYDPVNEHLYVSTHFKLRIFSPNRDIKEIFYQGQSIQCKSMAFFDGQMWLGTLNQGILVYEDGKFIRQLSLAEGLGDRSVKKIGIKYGLLFVSHRSGFQIQNLKTGEWSTLGAAEGVPNGSVQDFAVGKHKLWMLSRNTPIAVELDALPFKDPELQIHVDSVLLGGKRVNWSSEHGFSYDDNSFAMYLEVRGIDFLQEAKLFYRLLGIDTTWSELQIHEDRLEFKSLVPGTFQLELKCEYRNQVVDAFSYRFQIYPPVWQRWWFYLLIVAVVLCFTSLAFFARIRQLRNRNTERLERQKIITDLLESELKALRSQMNPHFIFNSLNAIQALLLNGDNDASYDYIVLFANLVRKALNHSRQEFIPITEELAFLETYLRLEKLRFGEEFTYEIVYHGPEEIEIPTLLVQPFIENAMLHGLLHRKGQKKLLIQFYLEDEQVKCMISDNGVGRKRSREIQDRRQAGHESFALESVQKRLDILNQRKEVDAWGFQIEDLQENGQPSGTQVSISMPFIRPY